MSFCPKGVTQEKETISLKVLLLEIDDRSRRVFDPTDLLRRHEMAQKTYLHSKSVVGEDSRHQVEELFSVTTCRERNLGRLANSRPQMRWEVFLVRKVV